MDKKRERSRKSLRESLREKGAHGGRGGVVNRERKTRGRERSTSATSGAAESQDRPGYGALSEKDITGDSGEHSVSGVVGADWTNEQKMRPG